MGIDAKADQKWSTYVRSILAFSAVSVLFLYGIQRLQHYLPLSMSMVAVTPRTPVEHRRIVRDQHQLAELRR